MIPGVPRPSRSGTPVRITRHGYVLATPEHLGRSIDRPTGLATAPTYGEARARRRVPRALARRSACEAGEITGALLPGVCLAFLPVGLFASMRAVLPFSAGRAACAALTVLDAGVSARSAVVRRTPFVCARRTAPAARHVSTLPDDVSDTDGLNKYSKRPIACKPTIAMAKVGVPARHAGARASALTHTAARAPYLFRSAPAARAVRALERGARARCARQRGTRPAPGAPHPRHHGAQYSLPNRRRSHKHAPSYTCILGPRQYRVRRGARAHEGGLPDELPRVGDV